MNTDIVKLESSESSEFRWSDTSDSSSDVGSNAIVEYNGNSNEIEETSLTSHEGAINDPQLNGDGEYAQRRVLPSSFQSFPSKVSSGPSKRFIGECALNEQWDPRQARPISVSENDQDNVHRSRSALTHMTLPMVSRNGKYVQSPQHVGFNDSVNRASLGEERLNECGERAIYQEALQNLDEPKLEDDLPKGLLSVTLLMHQRVALAWMVQKENSVHCAGGILADDQGLGKTVSMIALILKQRFLQSKFICSNSQHSEPEALNLEDDDGVPELDKEKQLGKDDPKRKHVYCASSHTSGNWRPAAGTLVVCPATVVRQWAREIDEKVTRTAKLSVLIYHGGTRTRDPSDLAKYDVVITTYSIVTNEVPKQSIAASGDGEQRNLDECELSSEYSSKRRKPTSNAENKGKKKAKRLKDSHYDYDSGPLARVRWFRVVLDEAQTIKNHRTLVANACSGLRAKKRWCLSGTPVQNSIDDLYSYFRFLKYDPYAVYSSFYNSIKVPISKDASYGYKKLQAVLKTVLLRRTKSTLINGVPIVDLPPKTFFLKKVDFSPEERSFYSKLEADSRKQFKKFAAAGTVRKNYASILLMLLRLRQACNHPLLVKGCHSDTVGKDSLKMASQLPRDLLLNLLHQLEGSLAICRVCNDPPENAVVTMCGHVFCYQCVSERLNVGDNLCQASGCKETLGTEMLFSQATLQSCLSDQRVDSASTSGSVHNEEPSLLQSGYTSSKIKAALEILNSLCSQTYNLGSSYLSTTSGIPVKAIVFSQWNGMLNLVEDSLNRSLIQYRRLDGSMTLAARDNAVMEFNDDPEVTVMLMSLKAGNLGLNMVAACHVILLDLWWNPATEDQAVDRAHRIGQIRPVTVSRLMIKDTVEDRILALQEEKRKIVSSAIGDDQPGGRARKLTMEDLKYLFMI